MSSKFTPKDFGFPILEEERIPESPPEGVIHPAEHLSPDEKKGMLQKLSVVPYLSRTLLECAWRLVELSHRHSGRYKEGMDVPLSCRAASTGAITTACAAFEANLNEELFNAADWARGHGSPSKTRILDLAMKLTPRDRLDALAAAYEHTIDWGSEPYQSLDIILSVRKHLLHHEVGLYNAAEGHWPANKLRDLQKRIGSPYSSDLILDWHHHVLTPGGAEWVVQSLCDVIGRTEEWWQIRRDRLENNTTGNS